ncbi:DUF2382 domain-containing protein [Ancylothrix sp. C2]|uniref:DUF2382 domain-containing protein n=1 Tax=Ancylothrix sp. D3o TaxID=2953691 RepID=UPI0021BAD333|nr:DUF2382 domain-containing protein [Ancylothrix sp. D3o]MCT7951642.1 DUF2382 domain-containing protein [Ancylothrix sp. D3o]
MLLYKIDDFHPQYRQDVFEGEDIKGLDVYAGTGDDKIGTIDTILVDETGSFRYFVVDTGFWIFGKKILIPIDFCRVDWNERRVQATGLRSKDQAEQLPRYEDGIAVDDDYQEQVQGIYRTATVEGSVPVEASLPLETTPIVDRHRPLSIPLEVAPTVEKKEPVVPPSAVSPSQPNNSYEPEPALDKTKNYDQQIKLFEERLIANKKREKAGEVEVNKRVETETGRVSVPVEKERVVIESVPITPSPEPVLADNAFKEKEIVRMEVYEETANIQKQAVVREEVKIRKEVDRDTVEKSATLRREELEVKTEGNPELNQLNSQTKDR